MGFLVNFWRSLFDFSVGQDEGRKFERMLRVALAETTTDTEFLALLYHMVQQDDYLNTETRWAFLMIRLGEYAHGQDKEWRVCAQRLLIATPKLYGCKHNAK